MSALGDVSHCARFEKTRFSMCIPAVVEHLNTLKVPSGGIHFTLLNFTWLLNWSSNVFVLCASTLNVNVSTCRCLLSYCSSSRCVRLRRAAPSMHHHWHRSSRVRSADDSRASLTRLWCARCGGRDLLAQSSRPVSTTVQYTPYICTVFYCVICVIHNTVV